MPGPGLDLGADWQAAKPAALAGFALAAARLVVSNRREERSLAKAIRAL